MVEKVNTNINGLADLLTLIELTHDYSDHVNLKRSRINSFADELRRSGFSQSQTEVALKRNDPYFHQVLNSRKKMLNTSQKMDVGAVGLRLKQASYVAKQLEGDKSIPTLLEPLRFVSTERRPMIIFVLASETYLKRDFIGGEVNFDGRNWKKLKLNGYQLGVHDFIQDMADPELKSSELFRRLADVHARHVMPQLGIKKDWLK